jgi:choline dehydrogenase
VTYVNSKFRRVSSETAYLTPEALKRKNFTVVIHATATRILFDSTGPEPRAIGVEFAAGPGRKRYKVFAKKDVVVW